MRTDRTRIAIGSLVLSAGALVALIDDEGYTDNAVIPVQGDRWTFGFGSTFKEDGSPVVRGDVITPPRAVALTHRQVTQFEGAIKQCVRVPLHQHEYDVYVRFTYNVGSNAFCASTLVRKLNSGDYDGACTQILRWRFVGERDCSAPENRRICGGLWTRRQAEFKSCLGVS